MTADHCDHAIGNSQLGYIEIITTESRDGWIWDQCPRCSATWNYRMIGGKG